MKSPLLGDLSQDDKKADRLLQIIEEHMEQLVEEIVQKTSVSESGVIQCGGTFLRLRAAVPLELRVDYGPTSYSKEFLLQNRDNLSDVLVIRSISVVEPGSAEQELACFDAQAKAIYRYVLEDRSKWESARRKTQIQGEACRGLAVKPDGTLTYLSGTMVYSESDEVIAGDIDGTCVRWVNDETFIFRGKDGALYSWEDGERKRLLDSVPEHFCYTSVSLARSSGKFTIPCEGDFWLGDCWIRWHWPYRSTINSSNSAWAKEVNVTPKKGARFAFAKPDVLRGDFHPSKLTYSVFGAERNARRNVISLKFPLDEVLILQSGEGYIVLKIVKAGYPTIHVGKLYHELGGKKDNQGQYIDIYYLRSDHPQLTLEWRRWNAQE